MTLRGTIFKRAFSAIGIANYVFDLDAEEQIEAAEALDAMMAEWEAQRIVLGYVPTAGAINSDDAIDTPAWADNAIVYNLALLLAPTFGKTPQPHVPGEARKGFNLARGKTIEIATQSNARSMIYGGGNRCRNRVTV